MTTHATISRKRFELTLTGWEPLRVAAAMIIIIINFAVDAPYRLHFPTQGVRPRLELFLPKRISSEGRVSVPVVPSAVSSFNTEISSADYERMSPMPPPKPKETPKSSSQPAATFGSNTSAADAYERYSTSIPSSKRSSCSSRSFVGRGSFAKGLDASGGSLQTPLPKRELLRVYSR